jgi:hypothetical protein
MSVDELCVILPILRIQKIGFTKPKSASILKNNCFCLITKLSLFPPS